MGNFPVYSSFAILITKYSGGTKDLLFPASHIREDGVMHRLLQYLQSLSFHILTPL